jgi:hypothetical protein
MKHFLLGLPILALVFMACQQNPAPLLSTNKPKAIGKLELTFDSTSNKATALIRSGLQTQAVQTSSNVSFTAPTSLSVLSNASKQYITAQFNVNNLLPSTSLTDLTLIAYQKTGNIGGTALKNVFNFAGSSLYANNDPTGIAFARAVKPTNTPSSLAPFVVNNVVSDVQFFTETELSNLQTAADTAGELIAANNEYLLPYGFVARNSSSSRTLAANTNNAGVVNIAIEIPISNSSNATTGYRFTMTFVVFDAPVATRVSESLQEQGAGSGANTRKTGFGASELFALGGSSLAASQVTQRECVLRTAGPSSTPLDYLVNAFNYSSFSPTINTNTAANNANVSVTTDQNMSAATTGNFVVQGGFTGYKAGTYSGTSSSTLTFDPTTDFMPGEMVTVQTLGLTNDSGQGACIPGTRTWQYRANVAARETFQAKTDYTTGTSPRSVALGDVNGDAKLDIITANYGDANTATFFSSSVLLGNGNGTFQVKTDIFTFGMNPRSVVVGDVSGDGKLDIITASYNQDSSYVYLGNGNGTFQAPIGSGTGRKPISVVVGDVSGDGKLDIITANFIGNSVSVLFGIGDGTFQAKIDYTTGTNPTSVVLGDVNNDTKLDIITTHVGFPPSVSLGNGSVLLGNGDGTFQAKTDYTTRSNPYSVALGDVNGDGKLDIITANYGDNSLSVLLNR